MGLYTSNASAPLQAGLGLRQFYKFGLYSYCGYISEKEGTCGNHTIGEQFTPFDAVVSDMLPQNYSILTANLIPGNVTLRDSKYLGQSTKAAYWMLLLGTLCAALALLTLAVFPSLHPNLNLSIVALPRTISHSSFPPFLPLPGAFCF